MSNMEIKLRLKECVNDKGDSYFIGNVREPIRLDNHVLLLHLSDEEGGGATLTIRRYDPKARRHKLKDENENTDPGYEKGSR